MQATALFRSILISPEVVERFPAQVILEIALQTDDEPPHRSIIENGPTTQFIQVALHIYRHHAIQLTTRIQPSIQERAQIIRHERVLGVEPKVRDDRRWERNRCSKRGCLDV